MPVLWSQTANYPVSGNPWSATPTKVSPGYAFFTPGVPIAAQEMNWLLNQKDLASVAGVSVPGVSWAAAGPLMPNTLGGTAYVAYTGGGYDPWIRKWLVCAVNNVSASDVLSTSGFGESDFASVSTGNTAGVQFVSATDDASHYFGASIRFSDGALLIQRCTAGGAWSAVVTDAGSGTYKDAQIFTYQGTYIVCTAVTNSTMIGFYAPFGGGAGGTWTSFLGPAIAGTALMTANNGSVIVCIPRASLPASYATSATGTSFTTRSATPFTGHTTETPSGLCYSPADGLFVLMTISGGSNAFIYTSPDGINWQQVTSFSATNVYGLAATAAGCICALNVEQGGPFAGQYQAIFSVDAGATWHTSQNTLPTGLANTFPQVLASPSGFLSTANNQIRFSHNSGLPALYGP